MPLQSILVTQGKGLCLLSFDAGGSRGISQLKILAELMHRLNFERVKGQELHPCDVFDMIGGSGSGGFAVLLLVALGLTAEQALDEFINLGVDILEKQGIDAQARTRKLRAYISNVLEKHGMKSEIRLMDQNDRSRGCKFLVPVPYEQHVGTTCMLRNFDVGQGDALNFTVADAMLATLAIPQLFSPTSIFKDASTFEYICADFALGNPTRQIISEAYGTFGEECRVACLLSLGCGHPGVVAAPENLELVHWDRFMDKIANDIERTAEEIDSQMGHLGLYYRFSVTRGLEGERKMSVSAVGAAIAYTTVYLAEVAVSRKLDLCASSLKQQDGVASLEQLKHSGGHSVLPPALPLPTRTFVMRKKPWEFVKKTMLGKRGSEEIDGPRMLIVTGMGGCGKTQLILKFVHVHKDQFATTFFIDGSSVPRIRADTIRHVRSLGNPHSQKGFEDSLLFLAQPSPGGPRLILYDNVDDPDINLAPLLPLGDSCAIVVTSRNRSLGELCPEGHLELDVMSIDEAVNLLLRNSNHSIAGHNLEETRSIARELGCLPIALTQARSYMYQTQCSSREYLDRLLNSRDKLLSQPVKNHRDIRYISTYAAFDAPFSLLTLRCQHLLRLLSYMYWSDFPLELVILAAQHNFSDYQFTYVKHGGEYFTGRTVLEDIFLHEGKWDITNLDDMIISLQNHSLINLIPGIGTKLVQIHTVAHKWVNSCIPEQETAKYQSAAILLLALGARNEHTPSSQYLASHVTHMSPFWDRLDINNAGAFAYILDGGGLFEGALQLQERVVTELRSQAEPDKMKIVDSIWPLALSYCNLGLYNDAELLQQEAIRLKTEVLGECHPDTISSSSNLALTYLGMGRLKEAQVLQEKVMRLRSEVFGRYRLETIKAYNNLASTYYGLGKLKEAKMLQEEVLKFRRQILGDRHPHTIAASHNLALTYYGLGRLKEAEMMQEVLKLRKELLGERHPDTTKASSNLANTYHDLGRLREAEILQQDVLKLRRNMLGETHPDTIMSSSNLANTYRDLGRLKDAEILQEEVQRLSKETLGEYHPHTIDASSNLASTYLCLGRLKEAEAVLEEVLRLRKEILGASHPDTINASMVLADIYGNLGRLKEAEELHEELLELRKEVQGDRHPDTIVASNNLAHCYLSMGRAKDAEALQLATLRQAQDILGNKHPTTATIMLTLAEIYESLHKKSDVLQLLDAAEAIFSGRVEQDHPAYLECQLLRTRVHALPDAPGTELVSINAIPAAHVATRPPAARVRGRLS